MFSQRGLYVLSSKQTIYSLFYRLYRSLPVQKVREYTQENKKGAKKESLSPSATSNIYQFVL